MRVRKVFINLNLKKFIMARKKKIKKTITTLDLVIASRSGEFSANKDIVGRTRSAVYKNKKAYSRKQKHKLNY